MTNEEASAIGRERITRPFAFEDLPLNDEGKRIEPEKWGPLYPATRRPRNKSVSEWIKGLNAPKHDSAAWGENCASNCASGQKGDFNAAKHRAKLKAEFTAAANAERRAWASGTLAIDRPGFSGNIEAAYKAAMAAKARRLTIERASARLQPKPHYVLRDGQWQLAA